MLIPKVMKGLEKSMAFSRTWVMVRGATARSAFCRGDEQQTSEMENREERVGSYKNEVSLLETI